MVRVPGLTAGILLLAVLSTLTPLGHSQTLPATPLPTTTLLNNSLFFTINPDKSVGIGWNTTTSSPSLSGGSSLFPQGYSIQSSTSFSQQSSSSPVVETSNLQYTLPASLNHNISMLVTSVSFSGSQTGLNGQGALTVTTTTIFPVQGITLSYSTSQSKIEANATAQIYWNSNLAGSSLNLFSSPAAFNANWTATFGSASWRAKTVAQITNATNHAIIVTGFNGTYTNPSSTYGNVAIGFVAIPSGGSTSFVNALLNALNLPAPLLNGFANIIQSTINLETSATVTMSYTGSSGVLSYHATANYVSNLDAQLNTIKGQFFQLLYNTSPSITSVPQVVFLNATSVTVSKMTITSSVDLSAGTASTSLSGLVIKPPTVGTSSNFTIPGLFQTLGSIPMSTTGVNITLTGGADSQNQVKVVVPSDAPTPTSRGSNSATWNNIHNATVLKDVQFQLQSIASSFFAILTSPTGIAIEAIIAAAIIATVVLLSRRRRAAVPTPVTPSGPAPAPGMGPSPAPPTP